MPAKNRHHDAVRDALIADGWTITHDPLLIRLGDRILFVDPAAERPDGEAVAVELIALEVQTFGGRSPIDDLEHAVGQFTTYRILLARRQPERALFLAVPFDVHDGILSEPVGQEVIAGANVPLFLFDPNRVEKPRWIR